MCATFDSPPPHQGPTLKVKKRLVALQYAAKRLDDICVLHDQVADPVNHTRPEKRKKMEDLGQSPQTSEEPVKF